MMWNEKDDPFDNSKYILPEPKPRATYHLPEEVLRRRLYVGPEEARSEDLVGQYEIGAIVSLGHIKGLYDYCVVKHIDYHEIIVDDVLEADITPFLDDATDWIHGKVAFGIRVLVHCQIGRSRSPSICIAYLMKYHHMTYDVAFAAVNKARDPIYPNESFEKQLREWGNKLD